MHLSKPKEITLSAGAAPKTPLDMGWLYNGIPDESAVYRFDCLFHETDPAIPPDSGWRVDWQYVGEAGDLAKRMADYSTASRYVTPSAAPTSSKQTFRLASKLLWALREDAEPDDPTESTFERRVFLSWATSATISTAHGTEPLDLGDQPSRRLAERVLIAQSPWSTNEA